MILLKIPFDVFVFNVFYIVHNLVKNFFFNLRGFLFCGAIKLKLYICIYRPHIVEMLYI